MYIRLNDITGLDVVIVLYADTALIPGLYLFDIVLEPSEGGHLAVVDNYPVPNQPYHGASRYLSVCHKAATDVSNLRNAVYLPDLSPSEDDLLDGRRKEPLHGLLHILRDLIDNTVKPYIHPFFFCQCLHLDIRADMKTYYYCVGSRCQKHIGLCYGPNGTVKHLQFYGICRELLKRLSQRLHRAVNIGLDDDTQFLYLSIFYLIVEVFKRDLAALGKLSLPLFHLPVCPYLFCLFLIRDDYELLSSLRHSRKALHLHRH